MKVPFYFFTIFLGIILAVHLSMNGKVGSSLANPRVGNALFWCIGALKLEREENKREWLENLRYDLEHPE